LGAGLFAAHFSAIAQSTGLPISYDVPSRSPPNIRSSGGGSLTQTPILGVDGVTAAYSPFVATSVHRLDAVDNTISLNGAVGSVEFAGTSPLTDFASSRIGWLFTQPDLASFGQYRMCELGRHQQGVDQHRAHQR
jgi:hypothetical protein